VEDAAGDAGAMDVEVAGPGFPRVALGLAWFGSVVGTGAFGWFVGGVLGRVLLGAAALGVLAMGAVVSNKARTVTLTFSALAAVAVIIAGGFTAALAAITGDVDVASAAMIGAVPVVGGLLSARLTRRAWRMAQ